MTVKDLMALLQAFPPEADVEVSFDISDDDTRWEIYAVELKPEAEARRLPTVRPAWRAVIKAK